MIEYTQSDVDRMQEAAKHRVKQEQASEAKAEAKAHSSANTRKAFDDWLKSHKHLH